MRTNKKKTDTYRVYAKTCEEAVATLADKVFFRKTRELGMRKITLQRQLGIVRKAAYVAT